MKTDDVGAEPIWFHSIDLGGGLVTPGVKSADILRQELQSLQLPEVRGRSILDIGAWDGYFSFALERAGAGRVVALDEFAWAMDLPAHEAYNLECQRNGIKPLPPDQVASVWHPESLPGRAGFDRASAALGSRVQPLVGDFMSMDLVPLGRFDVVLFLGVLYHLKDPFLALRRLQQLTAGLAVIETVCVVVPGREHHQLWEFLEKDELNRDASNWWAPNAAGLAGACRAAGFSRVEVKASPGLDDKPGPGYEWHYGRAVVHAWR